MRLIDGPTLKDLILRGKLDPRRALRILAQVAQALDEAHAAGLIHRDIKPQNILIGKGDHTYLADFGLIKAPDDAGLTGTGQFLGTIDYVAPEQIQGDPATGASDIYALSAVLFECLTGQVPFARANEAATLHAHVMAPPPQATELRPDLPPAIDAVIAAGMAKAPGERPASASELIRAAAGALATMGPRAGQQTRLSGAGAGAHGVQSTHVPGAPRSPAPVTALAAPSPAPVTAAGEAGRATVPTTPTRISADALPPVHESRRPRARLVLVLALAAAAIAVGFVIGHGGKTTRAQPLSSSAAAGHLELRYPSRWQLGAAGGAGVPGISFIDPIVLSAPGRGGGSLSAGEVADAAGPTLLPAAFRTRLQRASSPRRSVTLNGFRAFSYLDLRLARGAGSMSVYAVPTRAGVATIVCSGESAGFQSACAQVAATLRLVNTTAFPLGPDPGYAGGLSAVLTKLRKSGAAAADGAGLGTDPIGSGHRGRPAGRGLHRRRSPPRPTSRVTDRPRCPRPVGGRAGAARGRIFTRRISGSRRPFACLHGRRTADRGRLGRSGPRPVGDSGPRLPHQLLNRGRTQAEAGQRIGRLAGVQVPRTASQVLGLTFNGRYRVTDALAGAMGACTAPSIRDRAARSRSSSRPIRCTITLRGRGPAAGHAAHPRIVKIIDHFAAASGQYLVMELVTGSSWGALLKQRGAPGLPAEQAINYVRQACEGLQYVHDQQIVHRDVKPQNLILAEQGVVLVDFGIARLIGRRRSRGGYGRHRHAELHGPRGVRRRTRLAADRRVRHRRDPVDADRRPPPKYADPTSLSRRARRDHGAGADDRRRPGDDPRASRGLDGRVRQSPRDAPADRDGALAGGVDRHSRCVARPDGGGRPHGGRRVRRRRGFDLRWSTRPPTNSSISRPGGPAPGRSSASVSPRDRNRRGRCQTGGPASIPDCRDDPRFAARIAAGTGYVPYTMLVVPMIARGRRSARCPCWTVVTAEATREDDLEPAALFADLAVKALDVTPRSFTSLGLTGLG